MKTKLLLVGLFSIAVCYGQDITLQLNNAIKKLEADSQFKHAIISMYVVDSKTGNVVFDKNAQIGLVPASCQKVVTSVSAFEMLGKDFRYKTSFLHGTALHLNNSSHIYIKGSGDPTLGSFRFSNTTDTFIFRNILKNLRQQKIIRITDGVIVTNYLAVNNPIPDGYIWQDMGNYYGSGTYSLNWAENQVEIVLRSFKDGQPKVQALHPPQPDITIYNFLKNGFVGSGDNAYVYSYPGGAEITIRGTIPPEQSRFVIKGAMTNPGKTLGETLGLFLIKNNFLIKDTTFVITDLTENEKKNFVAGGPVGYDSIYNHYSPPLDSVNYWFLKKSVNLFGEAFVKTIAYNKTKNGSTDTGIAIIKYFWKQRGISPAALNIIDGSGLSPANRVTTNALVTVMQYAKKQNWFASFYNALPEMNGIKMKDGYISGVRSYTGYVKSKSGAEYTFSFIVNNFSGSAGAVREKMWKVLDVLK